LTHCGERYPRTQKTPRRSFGFPNEPARLFFQDVFRIDKKRRFSTRAFLSQNKTQRVKKAEKSQRGVRNRRRAASPKS
jgi:hypothetical protein